MDGFLPQVKGYRYLEEDNSDESDESDEEESEGQNTDDDDDDVVEEMGAGEEEEAQDARLEEVDSPRARRRGVEGQQHRREEEAE